MKATRTRELDHDMSTRDRILFESAELIAQRGYQATTTRDIAEAVGIRQPSLFYHFPSKAAIVEALLDWDLGDAVPRVKRIAETDSPASVRLYAYLQGDVNHLATSRFNLSGVYADQVIGRPEFSRWAVLQDELHATVEDMVRQGIASGEFIAVDAAVVRDAIASILIGALNVHSGRRRHSAGLGREIAHLLVRGLLERPQTIRKIAEAAGELDGHFPAHDRYLGPDAPIDAPDGDTP
jgi:AcrR family transcriptional regulator